MFPGASFERCEPPDLRCLRVLCARLAPLPCLPPLSLTRSPSLGSPACVSFALPLCRAPPLLPSAPPLHPSAPLCSSWRARRASGPREPVERLGGAYERRGAPAAPVRPLDGRLRSHHGRQAAQPALEIGGVGGAEPRLLGRLAALYQDLRGVRGQVRGRVMGGVRACHRRKGGWCVLARWE